MFELVRAQCPACGAKLKVDSRKDVAQCEYCGQRSMLHTRGTPPLPTPPPIAGAAPTPMPVIELPNPSRRIALALILPVVLMLFISGLVYFIISEVNETVRGALGGQAPGGSGTCRSADGRVENIDSQQHGRPASFHCRTSRAGPWRP